MNTGHYGYIDALVKSARAGDALALNTLAQFYAPLIQQSVKRCMLREFRLVPYREDLESESYLVLSELIQQYNPDLSYFSYYLSTRLDYALLSRGRRLYLCQSNTGGGVEEINFSSLPADWEPEAPDDALGRVERRVVIEGAFAQLPASYRDVIHLYFFCDLTQEQAAERLGIGQAAFSKRLKRALAGMRALVPDDFS